MFWLLLGGLKTEKVSYRSERSKSEMKCIDTFFVGDMVQ